MPVQKASGSRTVATKELPSSQYSGQSDGEGHIFLLHNEGAEHQQCGGDVDPIDILGRQSTTICDNRESIACNRSMNEVNNRRHTS